MTPTTSFWTSRHTSQRNTIGGNGYPPSSAQTPKTPKLGECSCDVSEERICYPSHPGSRANSGLLDSRTKMALATSVFEPCSGLKHLDNLTIMLLLFSIISLNIMQLNIQVQTHSNCIGSHEDLTGVIWVIELFCLGQLGTCQSIYVVRPQVDWMPQISKQEPQYNIKLNKLH